MNKRQRKKLKKKMIKINKARWLALLKKESAFFPKDTVISLSGFENRYGVMIFRDKSFTKKDLKKESK